MWHGGIVRAESAASEAMGFVASETSWSGELAATAAHCARTGQTLVISSKQAAKHARDWTLRYPGLDVTIDGRHWASAVATTETPTAESTLFDLDTWADLELSGSGAKRLLTPSLFVTFGDLDALDAQLAITGCIENPGLHTLVATDARMLQAKYRQGFFEVLEASQTKRFAFVFADTRQPMGSFDRLDGQRQLLTRFPGSHIVGSDVAAGTDAMVHGAGWVGIGASSGRRMEHRPGDSGGGRRSADYLPGTWVRLLMEMRSPSIYADWYANEPTPSCSKCSRRLESYQPNSADKALMIAHNLHGITDFADEIVAVPDSERAAWLSSERVDAFLRHGRLMGPNVDADRTLRMLCELDDPALRSTSPAGLWK